MYYTEKKVQWNFRTRCKLLIFLSYFFRFKIFFNLFKNLQSLLNYNLRNIQIKIKLDNNVNLLTHNNFSPCTQTLSSRTRFKANECDEKIQLAQDNWIWKFNFSFRFFLSSYSIKYKIHMHLCPVSLSMPISTVPKRYGWEE